MSKFIDRLEEIIEGAPARMGFGPARSEKTPGLALIVQVSASHKIGTVTATEVAPDGIIVSGLSGQAQVGELKDILSDNIWGVSRRRRTAGYKRIASGCRAIPTTRSFILLDAR